MSSFQDYTAGILARLQAAALWNAAACALHEVPSFGALSALNGVVLVLEDAQDIETQIAKAVGELGMIVIVGMPGFDNTKEEISSANVRITSAIAIGEVPTLWRGQGQTLLQVDNPNYDAQGNDSYSGLIVGQTYQWVPGANEQSAASTFVAVQAQYTFTGTPNAPFTGQLSWLWQKPVCLDVVKTVWAALQGLNITGFRRLRVMSGLFVPNKTRVLYELPIESQVIVQQTT